MTNTPSANGTIPVVTEIPVFIHAIEEYDTLMGMKLHYLLDSYEM